jgi:dienelactone hydrolase
MGLAMRWTGVVGAVCVLALALGCDDGGGEAEADPGADAGAGGSGGGSTGAGGDGGGAGGADAPAPTFCTGTTAHRWDPDASEELELWPDGLLVRDDPDSPTGRRLDVTTETAPWLGNTPDILRKAFDDFNVLTGFGTNGGVVLRFTEPTIAPPTGATESTAADAPLQWWDLETDPPSRIPYEASQFDEGRDLILFPLRPLRLDTRHAVIVTRDYAGTDGGCIAPAPTTQAVLTGTATGRLATLTEPWSAALSTLGMEASDVSALTVFDTHLDLGAVLDAAEDARSRDFAWVEPATCEDTDHFRRCIGRFEAGDYRVGPIVGAAEPTEIYTVNTTVWLPLDRPADAGPPPVLVYAHGINSERSTGSAVARRVVPLGFAVVATDALAHGEHPTRRPDSTLTALDFLGLSLTPPSVDALSLRGHFNQTALDRVQLIELLRDAPDIDGDGAPDLDPARVAYWGVSLGGMMGPSLMAVEPDIGAGIFSVAGGRLLQFATDTEQVKAFEDLIIRLIGSRELFERLIPVAQHLVDPADPATWAPHVAADRLVGAEATPSVLLPVALFDTTVPPATGRALARALGFPIVGEMRVPVETLSATAAPSVENGTFQFDRVSNDEGAVAEAEHFNTPFSPEATLQATHFLETWLEGAAEIIDPYVELATPALPSGD